MAIKAIIFDCFGVLYTDGKSRIIAAAPDDKKQEVNDLFMQSDYGYIDNDEFLQATADLIGISLAEMKTMTKDIYHRNQPLIDRIADYRQNYKVGLLSNVGATMINELFAPEDRAALFDEVVLSSDVGIIKPSPEIFHLMAQRLGVRPEECIMIDDLANNITGAEMAGMAGIVYTSEQQLHQDIEKILNA